MLLTIDAGNTRTKWAVLNVNGDISHHHACVNEALSTADFSPVTLGYKRVVISNVAGKEHATLLAAKLANYGLTVHWIKSSRQACGVSNQYATPETLGSDRWAALISAWHLTQGPCIVVNAGTAVTIDALQDKASPTIQADFIGGIILPGLNLMQQSLGLATAQLPTLSTTSEVMTPVDTEIFAKSTQEAVYSGALHAIVGAITLMAQALQAKTQKTPSIIISGGNAKTIYNALVVSVTNPVLIVDNLVLQGLFLLENAMSLNSVQSDAQ